MSHLLSLPPQGLRVIDNIKHRCDWSISHPFTDSWLNYLSRYVLRESIEIASEVLKKWKARHLQLGSFDIILRALKIAVSQERVALIISVKSRYLQSLLEPEEITRISDSIHTKVFKVFKRYAIVFRTLTLSITTSNTKFTEILSTRQLKKKPQIFLGSKRLFLLCTFYICTKSGFSQ